MVGTRGQEAEARAATRSKKKRGRTVAAQPAQGGPADKRKAPESTGGTDSGGQAVGAARRATRRTARGRDDTTDNPNPGPALAAAPAEDGVADPMDTTTTRVPATTAVAAGAAVAPAATSTVISERSTPSTPADTQPSADLTQGGIDAGAC